jgi:hypothetical protein
MSRGCIIPDIPDVAFINLEFPSGTVGHVELVAGASKLRRTTVVGSRKMMVYDDTSPEPVRLFDSGTILPNPETFGENKLTYRTGDIVSPHVDVAALPRDRGLMLGDLRAHDPALVGGARRRGRPHDRGRRQLPRERGRPHRDRRGRAQRRLARGQD